MSHLAIRSLFDALASAASLATLPTLRRTLFAQNRVGNVKRSCIHFVTPNGQIIPFETCNLFCRDGLTEKLRNS